MLVGVCVLPEGKYQRPRVWNWWVPGRNTGETSWTWCRHCAQGLREQNTHFIWIHVSHWHLIIGWLINNQIYPLGLSPSCSPGPQLLLGSGEHQKQKVHTTLFRKLACRTFYWTLATMQRPLRRHFSEKTFLLRLIGANHDDRMQTILTSTDTNSPVEKHNLAEEDVWNRGLYQKCRQVSLLVHWYCCLLVFSLC